MHGVLFPGARPANYFKQPGLHIAVENVGRGDVSVKKYGCITFRFIHDAVYIKLERNRFQAMLPQGVRAHFQHHQTHQQSSQPGQGRSRRCSLIQADVLICWIRKLNHSI